MEQQHASPRDAKTAFRNQFAEATKTTDRWLAVVFSIEDNGKVVMHRTTSQFPLVELPHAIDLLVANLQQESGVDTTPLPPAPGFGIVGPATGETVPVEGGGSCAIP